MPALTDAQLDALAQRGVVRVPSVLAPGDVDDMADAVWGLLAERDGVVRDDPSTWPSGAVRKMQRLTRRGAFDALVGEAVSPIADVCFGAGCWNEGLYSGGAQPLVTFPEVGSWDVPHKIWHFDLPARGPSDRLTALRVFGLFGDVVPRGGATLVVEGSHRLVARLVDKAPDADAGRSADVRRTLAGRSPWFAALARPGPDRVARFMDVAGDVDGVPVRVRELTGQAGDLWLMHPWLLHNLSPNVADRPRMMASETLYANDQPFWPVV